MNASMEETYKAEVECLRKVLDEKDKEIAQLKEYNDNLNRRDINLCRIANGIRDENFALKELLKKCREKQ